MRPPRQGIAERIALAAGATSIVLLVVWWWFWFREGAHSLWLYAAVSGAAAVVAGVLGVARRPSGRKPVAAAVGLVLGTLVLAYFVLYALTAGAD
jgi:hypothetical protein